ncbi:YpiF family protein [Halobacillus salinarum]|uniref:YpiF family protein n=1 Tax=Halobacillus salinarum TaxID=2932257 RepID=A0ABY4EEY6_9BACI|nr:DUF2487 family protein [Halobacillus salinarum]UOQ42721.1 YpiF family protein [Halobacillus salinarum]
MQWTKNDISNYLPEKPYIDTVLIPLIAFDPSADERMIKHGFQRELNQVFTSLMEREFKGRLFLAPEYNYLDGFSKKEVSRLNEWVSRFNKQPFQYIFLFTFDAKWKKHERELEADLIWIPGLSDGDIQSSETQSFVKEQVPLISELIQGYW